MNQGRSLFNIRGKGQADAWTETLRYALSPSHTLYNQKDYTGNVP